MVSKSFDAKLINGRVEMCILKSVKETEGKFLPKEEGFRIFVSYLIQVFIISLITCILLEWNKLTIDNENRL